MAVSVRILGPVGVSVDGQDVALGPQLRRLLALLAVNAGNVVSSESVADSLWPDAVNDPAGRAVRTYVARLRGSLGEGAADLIRTQAPGYVLRRRPPDRLDARDFCEAVANDRGEDPVARVAHLDDALALWNGPALAEFADEEWARIEAARLEQLRLQAFENRYEAALEAGLHASSVADLERLVAENPLRERLAGELMLALHRSGTQAAALRAYQTHRDVLADAGLVPSAELRLLDERIARDDPLLGLETEPDRIRGYLKGERLGEGAFSVVWRAVQPTVGRDVAIKQVKAELANRPEYIRAFEREAQVVATLEHPRIVPLYDFWREAGAAYLVMRYLRGGTLADAIPRAGAEVEFVTTVAQHVGEALQAAHSRGVVHGDVKPANIFLDDVGNAYLGDFGIAIGAFDEESGDRLPYGSPEYASPEQNRREPASDASDQFSLAVSLFEAMTGEVPVDDDGSAMCPLPALTQIKSTLPAALDEVLATASAADPSERFASVSIFVDAVAAAARNRPDAVAAGASEIAPVIGPNPYRGLAAFGEADAADFFGRRRLVAELVDRLGTNGATRMVTVVGPSGSGKSSVVRAGLVPAIRRSAIEGSENWFVGTMVPGVSPLEELEVALSYLETRTDRDLGEIVRRDGRGIARAVKLTLPDDESELLLVIDQFEELYTVCADAKEQELFSEALQTAVSDAHSRLRVVLTIRADFWDRPLRDPYLAELVEASAVHIVPMSPEELEEAVVEPARRAGCDFEPGLVARIGADIAGQPGALPLLQYTLTELYDHRDGDRLTSEAYAAMGGVSGAIAQRAEAAYLGLSDDAQLAARRLLGRLVTLGEGVEDTRRRVLRRDAGDDAEVEEVLDRFGTARLLSLDRDDTTREPTVEIAHEALLREWRRLRTWLDADRADLSFERHLERSARDWSAADRPESELYRGVRLESALEWVRANPAIPTAAETEYLAASEARAKLEQQRDRSRIRRLRSLLAGVAVVAVVALIAGVVALDQRGDARSKSQLARSRELAAAAISVVDSEPELAMLLALEASVASEDFQPEVMEAMHRALATSRVELAVTVPGGPGLSRTGGVDFSPDGSRFASTGDGGQVTVFDATNGEEIYTLGPGPMATMNFPNVHWTKNGLIVAAGPTGTLRVWDDRDGTLLHEIADGGGWFTAVSADGAMIAAAALFGPIQVFDSETGALLHRLQYRTEGWLNGAAFSPDNSRLVAGATNGRVPIWELASERLIGSRSHGENVISVEYTHEGRHVVSTSDERTAKAWDADTGALVTTFSSHTGEVAELDISPVQGLVASGGNDGTVRLWDLHTGEEQLVLSDFPGQIGQLSFNDDGSRLAIASAGGAAQIFDVTVTGIGELLAEVADAGGVGEVDTSPNGALVAAIGEDQVARVWDLSTGRQVYELASIGPAIASWEADVIGYPFSTGQAVRFAPDGSRLAVATLSGVRVWHLQSDDILDLPVPHTAEGLDWSPDGATLAVAGDSATLWDGSTGDLLASIAGPGSQIVDVALLPGGLITGSINSGVTVWRSAEDAAAFDDFVTTLEQVHAVAASSDGSLVAAAHEGGVARVWRVEERAERLVLVEQLVVRHADGDLSSVAFSDDGLLLATGGDDGTARVWDLSSGAQLHVLVGHDSRVSDVAFTPDGLSVMTGGGDGTIRVHVIDGAALSALTQSRVTRTFTPIECTRFRIECALPDAPTAPATVPEAEPLQERPIDDAIAIKDGYFEAQREGDVDAALDLFTADATFADNWTELLVRPDWEPRLAWDLAAGETLTSPNCTVDNASVDRVTIRCVHGTHSAVDLAVGAEVVPTTTTFTITPAGISDLQETYGKPDFFTTGRHFYQWLEANHPEATDVVSPGSTIEESVARGELLADYASQWAAYLEANNCYYLEGC